MGTGCCRGVCVAVWVLCERGCRWGSRGDGAGRVGWVLGMLRCGAVVLDDCVNLLDNVEVNGKVPHITRTVVHCLR